MSLLQRVERAQKAREQQVVAHLVGGLVHGPGALELAQASSSGMQGIKKISDRAGELDEAIGGGIRGVAWAVAAVLAQDVGDIIDMRFFGNQRRRDG